MKCLKCFITCLVVLSLVVGACLFKDTSWYPLWARFARYNTPVRVLDTNSSLGRYSNYTKEISLKDLARIHGHLCDGLVISYTELKYAFEYLFPDGVVDRTDLRVVTKNGPCWVDTTSLLSGARINFGTLSIDNTLVNSIIVQKISTGETYQVSLKSGVFPDELLKLESLIKSKRAQGEIVSDEEINELETLANGLSKKLLTTAAEKLLDIKKLENYIFEQNIQTGIRTDIINKELNR
ncbi:MAG: formylmethanofuran dehydrogenase subunit E family protein [Fusobacterium sp.]|nr:formylmethanofuran dehydrogenase subunit E family protein [Fusobacterium sp.]